MSLAAKGSRALVVDDDTYRWVVSPDSGYDVIVVQAANGHGAKLKVYVAYTQVDYTTATANGQRAITPALVTSIVRQGRQHGWHPDKTGPDAVCDLVADETVVPRTAL